MVYSCFQPQIQPVRALLIAYIVFLSLPSIAQRLGGLPIMNYYSSRDYEGGIQNWAITQNNDGLIYVANNFGLLEFDGNLWNRYTLPGQTKMRDVMVGTDGKIYVASQGNFGYFAPNNLNEISFTSLADSLPDEYRNFDETWKIFKTTEEVIFCTFREIFIFEDDRFVQVIDPKQAPENFHFVNHTLLINQLETGLSYVDQNNELKLFDQGDFYEGMAITGIIPLVNNHLLIATNTHGVFVYDGKSHRPWNPATQSQWKSSNINNLLRLRSGNMAIGTQNNGLYITDANGNILYHLNKGRGINNRTVLSMYEDVIGNLWLGHNNGISEIELNVPFTLISEQIGLPGTGYDGYLSNEGLYLGTNNGLYLKNSSNNYSGDFEFIEGTEGQVYNIQPVDNKLLLGHHKGTFILNGNQADSISGILGAWTFLPLRNHPEYVIGGTYKGLILFKKKGNSLEFVREIKGFSESSRVMELDENGNIWMTHGYKGVYRLTLNQTLDSVSVKFYGEKQGFPSNILINVWKIDNRLLFSSESQIYSYNEDLDRFVIDEFFEPYFPPESRVSYMQEDPMGNIYYLAGDEIGVLEKQPNGVYNKKSKVFNRLKGLLNDDLQNLSVLNSNHVIYGAKEGFIMYEKNSQNLAETPFKALVRKVNITFPQDSLLTTGHYMHEGKMTMVQPEDQIPVLAFINNSIHIEFSAPFFHNSSSTLYQYRLEGMEDNWSEWTTKTDKEYTNLHEGRYIFHVRSKNIYDQISETDTFEFVVLPPWYRSNAAYFGYAVLTFTTFFLVFYTLDTRYKREKQRMALKQRKEITQKESVIESSKRKIEVLQNEKLQAEVESKNKELATSTMHLLNKNSFINSVKNNISTISKRSKNQEVKKELSKVMQNIEKNMAEDNDWEHFAIHFDQVHGDFTKRIQENYPDLTPQEMKLSAYLRMNLSTKEIAHLLNISVRGVEIARYRLRKKLNLDRSDNLQEFILKY